MAKCKGKKCGCRTRILSNKVNSINGQGCFDVCTNPVCGEPTNLGLFAPLIYDEIGINLCTTFDLGVDIPSSYPTATKITAQIVDITYDYGDLNVQVTQISGRPNCYSVVLSNLLVVFSINIYDDACRLLDTITTSVDYLPSNSTVPTYNEDTNPSSVELEIFAPYGVSYNVSSSGEYTPALSYIGFISTNNYVKQGLNLYGTAKVLDFDEVDSTATVGISLVLQSLYFVGYKVPNEGKIETPKGCSVSSEQTDCLCFVEGDLLDLEIKPLELGGCNNEENSKQDCISDNGCNSGCNSSCNCTTIW
ncbi:MAG: hypothetical protein E7262_07075 [Lachnospiraceae bacterium]|nr:hypothetical protein [Lachnospiraceae bacterium]